MEKKSNKKGFTLIEILVVIGIIAILAAVVLIAINPARQFAQARNSQRTSNVNAILNAIGQRIADNKGLFTSAGCTIDIPTTESTICATGTSVTACPAGSIDIRACLVPTYVSEIPVDPSAGKACANSACNSGYNTSYTVQKDATSGRIKVCSPSSNESYTSLAENICVER